MLNHHPLKGKIEILELPDLDNPGSLKLAIVNHGNIAMPLPQTIPLKGNIGDGFFPYHLTTDKQGKYQLTLKKQTAPLNTGQQRIIGWMRCE